MAHWAEIDQNNKVIRVVVGNNESGDEGESFVQSLGGAWVKTSYSGAFRKHFAGIGFKYDEILDAFIPPKCHDEATLDQATCTWDCTNSAHK